MHVQITPAYPPSISGVGDYATALVQHGLFDGAFVNTVVASPGSLPTCNVQTAVLAQLTPHALCTVLEEIGADSVLLHFSGYGYARWGLCHWLIKGLRDWKYRHCDRRIITLFHEVFATGPVWRSSFWTSGMQRRIAGELVRFSDAGFVTSGAGYSQLIQAYPSKSIDVLPVFSNVGEPLEVSTLDRRQPQAVVFGGARTRQRNYDSAAEHERCLGRLLDQLEISDLIDIGPGNVAPLRLAGRPVSALGILEATDISLILAKTRVGLLDYPGNYLAKSGVAAAFLAHGVLLVNTSRIGKLTDGMAEGRELIFLDQSINSQIDLEAVAIAGYSWYRPHRLEETIRIIAGKLH
jgi:hypothetical protein